LKNGGGRKIDLAEIIGVLAKRTGPKMKTEGLKLKPSSHYMLWLAADEILHLLDISDSNEVWMSAGRFLDSLLFVTF
jgi:hypothetical protein